jgi:hypothetical protein
VVRRAERNQQHIPEKNFWSLILYDNQTCSMLQTGQPHPKVGSLNYPRPAAVANADGSTTIYIGPKLPQGVKDGNWIESVPGKGYLVCLRLYSRSNRSSQSSGGRVRSSW